MKKLFLLLTLTYSSIVCFAQKTIFGIEGGLNLAHQKLSVTDAGTTVSEAGSTIPSFHVGFFADTRMGQNFNFIPELLFSGEGSNFKGTDINGNAATEKIRLYYIRVPLNFVYETKLKGDVKFFIGAGPDLGFGLSGKVSVPDSSIDAFSSDGFKRFDFGVNFLTGVETKSGLRLSFNYYLGIASIVGSDVNLQSGFDTKWYNRVIGFSVGYVLGKK
jgi:Outer membrane protein beta-barrel domain